MITPQDQRDGSELFERLLLYRWAYEHRTRYDREPAMPVAMAIAYASRRISVISARQAFRRAS